MWGMHILVNFAWHLSTEFCTLACRLFILPNPTTTLLTHCHAAIELSYSACFKTPSNVFTTVGRATILASHSFRIGKASSG